jgi:hypothetical protein
MDPAPAGGPRRPRDDELASIDAQATYWLENIKPNSAQLTYATYEPTSESIFGRISAKSNSIG